MSRNGLEFSGEKKKKEVIPLRLRLIRQYLFLLLQA
jgi:hypothetical protein